MSPNSASTDASSSNGTTPDSQSTDLTATISSATNSKGSSVLYFSYGNGTFQVGTHSGPAPSGWSGDYITAGLHRTYRSIDETVYEADFIPSPFYNRTALNNTIVPGVFSNFLGCACNATWVSYGCCNAPDGIVHESAEQRLGSIIFTNATSGTQIGQSVANNTSQANDPQFSLPVNGGLSRPVVSADPVELSPVQTPAADSGHYICTGYCRGASRSCSWSFAGDCTCGAPTNVLLFWHSAPCIATGSNPNKGHDKKKKRDATSTLDRRQYRGMGPRIDPDRVPGVCNETYISYACSNAVDGIVHEPRENWLGAMLPADSKFYPPIPQEFLSIHGIREPPQMGVIDLPYW